MGPGGGGRLGLALGPRCLWAAALGWAPPRLAAGARYGLWAATRRGAAAPRGARGLRGSNPFTRGQEEEWRRRNRTALTYIAAAAVGMVGMSYAAVPLYRLYCQVLGGAPTAAFSPRGASGGAERGLCLCPGDRAGGNDGSGARRGADRGDGGGEGAGRQGHVQRRRALQPPVELQAAAERNLREWFPPLCPSSNVLTKAPRRLRVLPQALWSPHVPILQGPRFVRLGADLEENTAGASPRAYPAGCVPSTAWEGRAPVTAIKGFL